MAGKSMQIRGDFIGMVLSLAQGDIDESFGIVPILAGRILFIIAVNHTRNKRGGTPNFPKKFECVRYDAEFVRNGRESGLDTMVNDSPFLAFVGEVGVTPGKEKGISRNSQAIWCADTGERYQR
jgi:hypothetical protein